MLLAMIALGGAILGATTIAGILITYQIRATTDTKNSAKAIFAADSAVEWALYDYYCAATTTANPASRCLVAGDQALPGTASSTPGVSTLGNGAMVNDVTCYDGSGALVLCSAPSAAFSIAKGESLDAKRAFYLNLTGATATLP